LYKQIVPVQGLKLITAIVVALAIAFPTIKEWFAFQKKKAAMQKGGR
jgi:putative ABC transport system permease protein